MHIAIEGMDGVGKTSQAKEVARRINGEFIPKSFHEMNDVSGVYDSFVTIDKFTCGEIPGVYGLRQNYFIKKFSEEDVVTDRFYVSNYWSRADSLSVEYFKKISNVWGIPDLIIILYARPEILYERIYARNPKDKDLWKPQRAQEAYQLMFSFAEQMGLQVLVIDNSELSFEQTTEIILHAKDQGVDSCVEVYGEFCYVIEKEKQRIENETGFFELIGTELVKCKNKTNYVKIPENVTSIGQKVFEKCEGIITLEIPEMVKEISVFAFLNALIGGFEVDKNNENFSSSNGILYNKSKKILISYPKEADMTKLCEIEKVEVCAFQGCKKIKSLLFGEKLKYIGYGAFCGCTQLEKLTFSGKQTEFIAPGAFYNCLKLTLVEVENPFYYCEAGCLKDREGNVLYYFGTVQESKICVLPKMEYIYPFAFYARLKTEELVINCTKIGAFAFEQCEIAQVVLESGVQDIGERSFFCAGVEIATIKENTYLPEVWKNSFCPQTVFMVPVQQQKKYVASRDWIGLNIWSKLKEKKREYICGNACLDYIACQENIKTREHIQEDIVWITDMAMKIENSFHMHPALFYHNSSLMQSYYKEPQTQAHYALRSVHNYISGKGRITEEKISVEKLKEYHNTFKWIILCLRSDILFCDERLVGSNHFTILERMSEQGVYLISPGKERYYRVFLTNERLLLALENNGQWIMGVERNHERN